MGVRLRPEDQLFEHFDTAVGSAVDAVIANAVATAVEAARLAARNWKESIAAMPVVCPELRSVSEVKQALETPRVVADAAFAIGDRVEAWSRGGWYKGTVSAVHEDCTYNVDFDEVGFWGSC